MLVVLRLLGLVVLGGWGGRHLVGDEARRGRHGDGVLRTRATSVKRLLGVLGRTVATAPAATATLVLVVGELALESVDETLVEELPRSLLLLGHRLPLASQEL
jgi:hypothetical protein